MKDWRLEDKQAQITRYGGSWGNPFRTMTVADALAWFSKYGYKAVKARDLKHFDRNSDTEVVVGRQVEYRKPNCRTEYTMTIRF